MDDPFYGPAHSREGIGVRRQHCRRFVYYLLAADSGGLCGPWGRCVAAVFCKLFISWLFQKMDIP